MSEIQVSFKKKEQIAKNSWIFFFAKTDFDFLPGQYVTIFLGNDSRDFTIASSPLDKDSFFIVTNKGESSFKNRLFSLKTNAIVEMQRPTGGFILREDDHVPRVFLAGGIGITPFYSMICYANEKKLQIPITLLVSFSKKRDIIFYDELLQIEKRNEKIKIIYTLTQEKWENDIGRISDILIRKHMGDVLSAEYMIAGGEQMVEDTEELLLKMGIDQRRIRIDIFTGYS